MNKIIVPIAGMHCRSCEMLIEDKLSEVPEIERCSINYRTGKAEIFFDSQKPNPREIEEAIRLAGYAIGSSGKKPFLSRNSSDYKDLGIAFLFLVGAYFILKNFGLTNFSVAGVDSNPSSLGVVFLVGITAGLSTCMALVGGLVLGISARHADKHPEATPLQKFRPHLFFNIGRVLSYAILGGLLGSLGSFLQLSGTALGVMTIGVGVVMLLLGLKLTGIFPRMENGGLMLPKGLSRILGIKQDEREYSHRGSMMLGALTFFLPCGFTQAMQLYAINSGSFTKGAMIMGLFALGTAPGLLGIGGLTSVIKGIFAQRFFKFAGIVVVLLAFFNIANGYNLTGWQLGSLASFGAQKEVIAQRADPNVALQNGVQIVRMTESSRGYSPNAFTVQKGVPVRWVIDAQAPYSCASSLVIQKLGIRKSLRSGENIIEFTPTEVGRLPFSCSMGMYAGVFNVVDGNGGTAIASNDVVPVPSTTAPTGGGCGGGGSAGGGCGGGGGGCCGGGAAKVQPTEGTTETVTAGTDVESALAETAEVSDSTATADNSANSSAITAPTVTAPAPIAVAPAPTREQIIRSTYTFSNDIQPNVFTVKAGVPVIYEIDVKDNGGGCMSTVMLPGLSKEVNLLEKGTKIVMKFTPEKSGTYDITCAMGVPRGTITVE